MGQLSSQFKNYFDRAVRQRGEDYHRKGQVEITHATPKRVLAQAYGTMDYELELSNSISRKLGVVTAFCDCPYFEKWGACKHLWALFLALENSSFERELNDCLEISLDEEMEPRFHKQVVKKDWQSDLHLMNLSGTSYTPQSRREIWFDLELEYMGDEEFVTINFCQREWLKSGCLGKIKQLRLDTEEWDQMDQGELKQSLGRLMALASTHQRSFYYQNEYYSQAHLPWSYYAHELGVLAKSGRLLYRDRPLKAQFEHPYCFKIEIRVDEGTNYRVLGVLLDQENKIELSQLDFIQKTGLFIYQGVLGLLEPKSLGSMARLLYQREGWQVRADDLESFLGQLIQFVGEENILFPKNIEIEKVYVKPVPVLHTHLKNNSSSQGIYGDLNFSYSGYKKKEGELLSVEKKGDKRVFSYCDKEEEKKYWRQLQSCEGVTFVGREIVLKRSCYPKLISSLLEQGWQVMAKKRKVELLFPDSLAVSSGQDWFDLSVNFETNQLCYSLPEILKKKKDDFIDLGQGRWGVLSGAWQDYLNRLAEWGESHEQGIRFQGSQAILLQSFLEQQRLAIDLDQRAKDFFERIKSIDGVSPQKASKEFRGKLRCYQELGLGWMEFLQGIELGGCLADDMGLGKTVQVLALLQNRISLKNSSLIVVPKTLLGNWQQEATRFTPQLKILIYSGSKRKESLDRFDDCDLIITSYGVVRRDILTLKEHNFDYIVLDEAQAIKNEKAQTSKAIKLLKAKHRLALSGTPVENHLGELYSLFDFLMPGLFGRINTQDSELYKALRPFILRRTKQEVLKELPPKVESTIFCDLSGSQKKIYGEIRDYYRSHLQSKIEQLGMARSKVYILEGLLRLRQAACHPAIINEKYQSVNSVKFEVLLNQVTDIISQGHKALIFSQFTSLLKLFEEQLNHKGIRYQYLDGKSRKREQLVESFQNNSQIKLFLISIKAGGLGLNLTSADYCFILDPWWNPAVEAQAIDRIHRIGQTKKVFAYRIIAKDTVEEKLIKLQEQKRALANEVLSCDESFLKKLSYQDLCGLLS